MVSRTSSCKPESWPQSGLQIKMCCSTLHCFVAKWVRAADVLAVDSWHFCRVMLRSIRHCRQLNVFIFVPEKRPIRLSLLLLICHEARRNVLLFFHNIPDYVCLKSLQRWSSSILGKQLIRNKQKQKRWPCNSNSIKYNMIPSWLWLWSLECEKTESVWWCNTSLPTSFPFPTFSMFVLDFRLIKPNCDNSSGAINDTSVAI